MNIVRIYGSSYSGSTVLGYILNSVDNWFFASEVYRVLPLWSKENSAKVNCSFCGSACEYWTHDLKMYVQDSGLKVNTPEVYKYFSDHYDIDTFIDGSKNRRWYNDSIDTRKIVTVKHPMKLLASFIYNTRKQWHMSQTITTSLGGFKEIILKERSLVISLINDKLGVFIYYYGNILSSLDEYIICKTDILDFDNYTHARKLCEYLGLDLCNLDIHNFSKYEIHPLGGNRAPLWSRKKTLNLSMKGEKDSDRLAYYDSASRESDYVHDEKYKELFSEELLFEIMKLPNYIELCELFGYDINIK